MRAFISKRVREWTIGRLSPDFVRYLLEVLGVMAHDPVFGGLFHPSNGDSEGKGRI